MKDSLRIVIGIDPGLSGAIALMILNLDGSCQKVQAFPMPTKPGAKKGMDVSAQGVRACLAWPNQLLGKVELALIEDVHAMKGQGVTSSFSFGRGYGKVLGVLECLDIPYQTVQPQRWKKAVLDGLGREKSDAIRWVQNRFPTLSLLPTAKSKKPSDGMAEAVCIAEYGRRLLVGTAK